MSARRERGMALLLALLVVALAGVLVAASLDDWQLAQARVRNQLRADQASAYARGLEAWAAHALERADAREVDSNDAAWAMPLPPTPVPGGSIQGRMRDLGGCFNLNNLVQDGAEQPLWSARFERLLQALRLSPTLLPATLDWLDPDARPRDGGAEDRNYQARDLAYLAANRRFADVSELRLVAGVDAAVWEQLAPHVCALPTATAINLNTASVPVLMSLARGMTAAQAERVWRDGHARWNDVDGPLAEWLRAGVVIAPAERQGISVRSEYFRARGVIELDGILYEHSAVLQREQGVRVIRRALGET